MGSEMCIRDSDNGPAERHGLHERQVNVSGAGRQVHEHDVEFTPIGILEELVERLAGHGPAPSDGLTGIGDCLLYTSDAADERSSVDLGGRRIIKKKKSGTLLSTK